MNDKAVPPSSDQIELSLFGSGFGEAVLVHMGKNQWIVVDSCLDPASKQPALFAYMKELGIDWSGAVRLIVVSHWHDDHIRGISSIVEECPEAKVWISGAMTEQEFRKLVFAAEEQNLAQARGVDEFLRISSILEARKATKAKCNPPRGAIQNRVLLQETLETSAGDCDVKVTALSPSDASVHLARQTFGRLYSDQVKHQVRVPSLNPNEGAVALWVEIGCHKMLLGSDLETVTDPMRGWHGVLANFSSQGIPAGIFKKAHHGARSAHHPDIWTNLLSENACTVLTTWSNGGGWLPTDADILRITSLTDSAYVTSLNPQKYNFKDKVVKGFSPKLQCLHPGWGQIRLRSDPNAAQGISVELFGSAVDLHKANLMLMKPPAKKKARR